MRNTTGICCQDNPSVIGKARAAGITLVALVVTIVVLLILAGITIMYVMGDNGVFKQASDAKEQTDIAKAREKLEVALSDAKIYKHTEAEYNENEYLDELILNKVPDSKIKGDVAISDGYAFLLDRSIPWIGEYVGKEEDLIFPEVTVAEVIQADSTDNYRTATITITATIDEKAKNGIERIEIWQNGVKLYTIDGNNEKNITTEYEANRNGKYTIKAYAELSGSAKTTVEGIVPAVEFSPNGSTEWKKSHTTTVKVKETTETVAEMKFLWKKSSEGEPQVDEFTESCANNSTITGQGEDMTGEYYLWVLVTIRNGTNTRTYINGSEKFYFDNEGPTAIIATLSSKSEEVNTLNIECEVNHTSITQMRLILNNKSYYASKINECTFQADFDSSERNIDTAQFEAINSAGDVFNLSRKDSVVSTIMWDTAISHIYQWKAYAISSDHGIWGANNQYIQRYKGNTVRVSFDVTFEEDTGYFNVKNSVDRTIESMLWEYVWVVNGDGRFKGNEIRYRSCRKAERLRILWNRGWKPNCDGKIKDRIKGD